MELLDHKNLWTSVLADIELNVSPANFGTWFKNTCIFKEEDGLVYLGVPNAFVRDWLNNKYHKLILRSIRELYPEIRGVEFIVNKKTDSPKTAKQGHLGGHSNWMSRQIPLEQEPSINKEDNLNPRYVFDLFVVAPFNELAHAAAQAVIKNPGRLYNPLLIYGGTGLGKTHLMQAVGNCLKNQEGGAGKRVYYLTSEMFLLDYVSSVQNKRGNLFKEKYRKYDVLIMDDVQFLSQKEKTQEELFHLFNVFHENNKQLIFSSDKPPKQLHGIEERLKSRLEGGMIVDVSRPDYESRLAILKHKTKSYKFCPSEEVLDYLASAIQDNIRELEGALNSIVCQSYLKKRPLSLNEVKNLVRNSIRPPKNISVEEVTTVVAEFYNIEVKQIHEKTRKKEVVKPRQVAMYLLREDFNTSFPYIGQKLGGKDHTTVIHAYSKIKRDLDKNSVLSEEINQIRNLLSQNK